MIWCSSGDYSWLKKTDVLWLEVSGKLSLFHIKKTSQSPHGVRITTEELKDRTQAEAFVSAAVMVPMDIFISAPGEVIYLSEILNFEVWETKQETEFCHGQIIGFSSNGVQDLLRVQNAKGVFEVPFVEDFIEEIDFETHKVWMQIPEGLQDL